MAWKRRVFCVFIFAPFRLSHPPFFTGQIGRGAERRTPFSSYTSLPFVRQAGRHLHPDTRLFIVHLPRPLSQTHTYTCKLLSGSHTKSHPDIHLFIVHFSRPHPRINTPFHLLLPRPNTRTYTPTFSSYTSPVHSSGAINIGVPATACDRCVYVGVSATGFVCLLNMCV
jgi:hypothetical protein